MNTARAHIVTVVRDETTRIQKPVWEWELPILKAKHPEGYVIESGETQEFERDLPDPAEEFERLNRVYKQEPDSRMPFVQLVYGYREQGVAALAKLIDAAGKPLKAPAAKKATGKKQPADPLDE